MLARAALDRGFHHRMQHRFRAREMLCQKRTGEFNREKLMPLLRGTTGFQRLIFPMIKTGGAGGKIGSQAASLDKTMSVEIQTKFNATGMKARRPVQLSPRE